jgi:hypothetical protein
MADQLKKVFYHSEAVGLGPFKVTVLSDILESKQKKGTYYVKLQVQGRERHLHPENEACLEFWRDQNGRTFTVVAEGSREEAQFVYVGEAVADQEAAPAAPTPPKAPPSARPPAKPPAGPKSAPQPKGAAIPPRSSAASPSTRPPLRPAVSRDAGIDAAKRFVARNLSLAKIALKAATALKLEFETLHTVPMPDALFVSIYASLLYGANSAGIVDNLPVNLDLATLRVPHIEKT